MSGEIGYCPICGAPGVMRERRPNGNDTCLNRHVYPSKDAKQFQSNDRSGDRSTPSGPMYLTDSNGVAYLIPDRLKEEFAEFVAQQLVPKCEPWQGIDFNEYRTQ